MFQAQGVPGVQGLASDVSFTLTLIASIVFAIAVLGLAKKAKEADRKLWPGLLALLGVYVAFVIVINPARIGPIADGFAAWLASL